MAQTSRPAFLATAVSLISVCLYLFTLAPGLTWAHDSGDGGELAAAAHHLGVPHPPGAPTYLLAAHLFTRLPVGEIATRTNLFSACCAAAAAGLLTWTLARRPVHRACAVGAGLALAVSPLLWSQAVVTEIYALNALLVSLLLTLAGYARPGAERRSVPARLLALVIGGVWGLGLGTHPTLLFCAPLVVLALWRLGRPGARGALGVALGLAVYLYLPLRAIADPPINWGDPQTWPRFWWMVSGAPYRGFLFAVPREYLLSRLLAWGGLLARQFTGLGALVALLGAITLWRTDRGLLYATGATAALCSILAIGYNTSDSYLYLIPALVSLAYWLGIGLDRLFAVRVPHKWVATVECAGTVLVLLLPLAAAAVRYTDLDLSQDRAVQEFADAVFEPAPPRALLLSQQDAHTFTLWYMKHALGRRTDVDIVDLDLLAFDWYTVGLSRELEAELSDSLVAATGAPLEQWSAALGRPACRIERDGPGLTCVEPE